MSTCAHEQFHCIGFVQPGVLRPRVVLYVEFLLGLLDSVVRSAESLYEGELCCSDHRKKFNVTCWLCKIYYKANTPMHEYLNNFVAARDIRASVALGEIALLMLRCRTEIHSVVSACLFSVELAAFGCV